LISGSAARSMGYGTRPAGRGWCGSAEADPATGLKTGGRGARALRPPCVWDLSTLEAVPTRSSTTSRRVRAGAESWWSGAVSPCLETSSRASCSKHPAMFLAGGATPIQVERRRRDVGSRGTILVVDDNLDTNEVLVCLLA